jgi:hypothetical protein
MAIKQFSGRKNLAIDLVLSIFIALLMPAAKQGYGIYEVVGFFTGKTLAAFFLFFVWSWRTRHIQQDKLVSRSIHTLFISMFITCLLMVWVYFPSPWPSMVVPLVWGSSVAIKYKSLFWPKKCTSTDPLSLSQSS